MKTKNIIPAIVMIVATIVLSPSMLFGQSNTKALNECIQLAMDNNLTMQSGRISIQRAKDLEGTAFNIDKTSLSYTIDPASVGSIDRSISLSQSFNFPTVYGSRKGLLKAETDLEKGNFEVTKNELIKEVTSAYYQLLYVKENIKILQVQDSIYNKFLFLANAKLKAGEAGRLEQMNAERLYNENKIELQNAQTNYQNIQLSLQRWMNSSEFINPIESDLTLVELEYLLNEFDPKQTPVGNIYTKRQIISKKNLDVTKQGYLPSFNFSLKNQYGSNQKWFGKNDLLGFEIGVSVPLFFGEQRAKTKAAKRDIEIAKVQQEDVMLSMQKSYQSGVNDYLKAKKTLDYYSLKGNKQAENITRISQISYEKGEIGYIEYIQNLKTSVEIHLQYASAINDYNQAIIVLNYLQGNK